jgi:transcriptional regulator with XRE-family HTH domain
MWRAKVTQKGLAAHLGISQPSIAARLNGTTQWTLRDLLSTSALLGTTVAYLVGETDEPNLPGVVVGRTGLEPVTDGL